MIGRRGGVCASGLAAIALLLGLGTAAAGADVLVNAIKPTTVACGKSVQVGVWYQRLSGGPRWARITIKTSRGVAVWRRNVTATGSWRYWHYKGACGRRYVVVYRTAGGTATFPFRVAPKPKPPAGPTITIGNGAPTIASGTYGDTLDLHDFSGNALAVTVPPPTDPAAPSDQANQPPSGSRLIAISEKLTDLGPGTVSDDANVDTSVVGTDGQVYTASFANVQGCTNFNNGGYTLAAGQSESGCVLFALPTGVGVALVQFTLTEDSVDLAEWSP